MSNKQLIILCLWLILSFWYYFQNYPSDYVKSNITETQED
jgi:hypothetical protein